MGPCLSSATGLYLSRMLGFFHRKETMKEQDHPINIHCLSWWNILHTYWLSSCPSKLTYAFADRTARLGALDLNLGGKWLKNWGNWAQSLFLLDHAWCLPGDAMGLAHCTCVCGALGLVISLSLASSFFFSFGCCLLLCLFMALVKIHCRGGSEDEPRYSGTHRTSNSSISGVSWGWDMEVSRSFSVVSGPVCKHSPLMPPEFVFRVPMKGQSSIRYTSNWNSCHLWAKGPEFLFEQMKVTCVSNRAFYTLKLSILEKQSLYW